MVTLLVIMAWVFSGVFSAFLMVEADKSMGENPPQGYWLKTRKHPGVSVAFVVLIGPVSLLLSAVVVYDYAANNR